MLFFVLSILIKVTFLYKLCQQVTPLITEDVSSGEAAISTAHTQISDATLHQVKGSCQTTLFRSEILTASTANNCATLKNTTLKTLCGIRGVQTHSQKHASRGTGLSELPLC